MQRLAEVNPDAAQEKVFVLADCLLKLGQARQVVDVLEGIGKLAAVYVVGLFGFIIWFGLIISWLFFGGVHPPIVHP